MNQTFQALMEKRVTAGNFDPHRSVGLDLVRKLVQIATLAPSAFNLQNWRFIGVHSGSAKKRLCELAYGQRQVLDASVTFIVCGELDGYRSLRETLKPSVDAGILPSEVQETWCNMVTELHKDNPQLRRDEAFRSASLASMALMLAAKDQGLASGAMSGFDAKGVSLEFGLPAETEPVMLVTVGFPLGSPRPRKIRKPVDSILEMR